MVDPKFTITLKYDRDEILDWVQKCIDMDGDIYAAKSFLDMLFPAWKLDQRTSCMVELMFRDGDDMFYDMFTKRLAELDAEEGESEPVAECWSWCEDPLCPYIHP